MLREYDLDLSVALPVMSWRRFDVLVRGLSPHSATINQLAARRFIGGKGKRGRVNEVTDPKAAQRTFEALFRPPRQKRPD